MTRSLMAPVTLAGSGPPLLLVPGMDGTGRLFYRQVPLLARHFTVATCALRNEATTMQALTDDLDVAVDRVSPSAERVIIVGESFGGAVALSYAIARPDKVRALVVLNSFPYFAPQRRLRLASLMLRAMPVGVTGLIRRLTAFRLYSPQTHREDVARFLELTRDMSRDGYLNRLRILQSYDVRDRLPAITTPTLLLAAEHDRLVPSVAQARLMAQLLPGSTVRVLAGHGHSCLIAPDVDLSALLLEWLRDP
jgi:pimeloyl-ACP methyl ester carboxylesterase